MRIDTLNLIHKVRKVFLTGLIVLLPLLVPAWLFFAFAHQLDRFFAPFLAPILPHRIPGLGFILGTAVILLVGVLTPYYVGRRFQQLMDKVMMRIPFIRGVYSTTRQVINTVRMAGTPTFQQVVLVEYPRRGMYMIGFVTVDARLERIGHPDPPVVPPGEPSTVFVFIPTTPNPTSGFLTVVSTKDMVVLDMTPEEALRLIVSAGIVQPERFVVGSGEDRSLRLFTTDSEQKK